MSATSSPSDGSYRLPVPPLIHTLATLELVGCSLSLILYGLVVSLFILCIKSATQGPALFDASRKRPRIIQIAYVCAVFTVATTFIAADTWAKLYSTLEYPLYPGGPVGWSNAHYNHPVIVLGNVSFLLTSWLSDGFMMYRCYIVYARCWGSRWILTVPSLLYLASLATGFSLLVQTSLPSSSLFAQVNFALANFSIMATLHLTLTLLVSAKLLFHRVRMQKIMGSDTGSLKMYTSISTILIESSALYSVFVLAFIIPFAMGRPAARLVLPMLAQVQVIAPLLVAHRLTREMAWTPTTSQTLVSSPSAIRFTQSAKSVSSNAQYGFTAEEKKGSGERLGSQTTLQV